MDREGYPSKMVITSVAQTRPPYSHFGILRQRDGCFSDCIPFGSGFFMFPLPLFGAMAPSCDDGCKRWLTKHKYHEGEEAKEKFEKLATHLFRAPKSTVKMPVRKPKKTSKD
jgi:hypothetical protein